MTTTATSSIASYDRLPAGHRVSWRRLVRVARIQHRAALITILVALVVLVIAIILGRDGVSTSYASYLAAGCTRAHPTDLAVCPGISNSFADGGTFTALVTALRAFPVVIGAFVGTPLVAREVESGTYRFAWTQGVGRTRLLLVTLAMLAVIVTPVAVVLGLLLGGWYAHPYVVINAGVANQWQAGLFTTTWWMAAVWTLFALALGTFLGAVIKRTVAAIAATAFFVGGILVAVAALLPQILSIGAVTSSRILLYGFPFGPIHASALQGDGPAGSWLARGWFTGPDGRVLATSAASTIRDQVSSLYGAKGGTSTASRWLALHHDTYWVAYQPADHFWILQAVAGLIVLAFAVMGGFATSRSVRNRRA